jgi:hypothetical protein
MHTCRNIIAELLLVRQACMEHAHTEPQVISILEFLAEQLVLAIPVAQLQPLLPLQDRMQLQTPAVTSDRLKSICVIQCITASALLQRAVVLGQQ